METKITGIRQLFTRRGVIFLVAVGMSIFHLYTGFFGSLAFIKQTAVFLGCALVLVFLIFPAKNPKNVEEGTVAEKPKLKWYDYLLIVMSILPMLYLFVNFEYIQFERIRMVTPLTTLEIILGLCLIIALLEATRRTVGLFLSVTGIVFIVYTFVGPYLPGFFKHNGISINNFFDLQFLSTSGIFGVPVQIAATYIVLFIIFGAFMLETGFGELICDVATGLTGRTRGGPAKIAVVSSAGFGMISGSGSANVAVTGTFTIPLMKKVGYTPTYAGAVEAAASTGGEIMPPIMGAAAFLMAQYAGIPYIQVIYHAFIPAILYFMAIFFQVDFQAAKMGIRGLSKDELPPWKEKSKQYIHLVFPIIVLLVLMIIGKTAFYAVTWSIALTIILSFLRKSTRMNLWQIMSALEKAAKSAIFVAIACALAGLVVGCIYQSGLGIKFTSLVVELGSVSTALSVIAAAFAGLILGMGMPIAPAYVLMIALVIPAMVTLGFDPIASHLFVIHICRASLITPPVAISAYVAAGIAGAPMAATGWKALQLGIASFLVPFIFVFSPSLLLIGSAPEVILAVITGMIGIYALASAIEGYLFHPMNFIQRILAGIAAITFIIPGWRTDLIGVILFAAAIICQIVDKKSKKLGVINNG
ncbi:MAG: TRAP transporter permease [Clostridiales bacterium]|nr:TRAP transporter permease [Clostridiales bacterium]